MGRFISVEEIPVEIERKKGLRAMRLKISNKTGKPVVTAPILTPDFWIKRFLEKHAIWIRKQLEMTPAKTPFKNGEKITLLGEETTLRHQENLRRATFIESGILYVAGQADFFHRRVVDFIKKEVKKHIETAVFRLEEELGVRVRRITLKDTTSRWGSCSSGGNLAFSWRLGLAPLFVLDYVIVHEVMHLKHMDHSDAFWRDLRRINPDVLRAQKWLKENGRLLHRYL